MHLAADAAPTNIPVPGYVIQTDDGKNILIDTGFPYNSFDNARHAPLGITVEISEEDFVVNRLAAIGL